LAAVSRTHRQALPGLLPDDAAGRAHATQWMLADLFHAEQPRATERRPVVVDAVRMRLMEYLGWGAEGQPLRGRWLSCSAVRFSSACELAARSVPFGKY